MTASRSALSSRVPDATRLALAAAPAVAIVAFALTAGTPTRYTAAGYATWGPLLLALAAGAAALWLHRRGACSLSYALTGFALLAAVDALLVLLLGAHDGRAEVLNAARLLLLAASLALALFPGAARPAWAHLAAPGAVAVAALALGLASPRVLATLEPGPAAGAAALLGLGACALAALRTPRPLAHAAPGLALAASAGALLLAGTREPAWWLGQGATLVAVALTATLPAIPAAPRPGPIPAGGVATIGPDGKFLEADPAFHATLARPAGALVGTPFHAIVPTAERPVLLAELKRLVAATASVATLRVRLQRPDGTLVDAAMALELRREAGRIVGFAARLAPAKA